MTNRPPYPEHFCNMCGLTCHLGHDEYKSDHGLIEPEVSGGYASTPGNGGGTLDDMTTYAFSMCEFCLDWLFAQFKVPPTTGDARDATRIRPGETMVAAMVRTGGIVHIAPPDPFPEPPWEPAAVRVERDEWRQDKATFFAEKARRDAARAAR